TSNQEQDSDFILEAFRDIKITTENIEYKLTAKVFPTTRQVHFLNDDKIEDRIFAFIILVELDDYLVVMSKSCANFSQI
ncbi:hypothetical protein WAH63_22845, partial [Acinetobacter baumannii]